MRIVKISMSCLLLSILLIACIQVEETPVSVENFEGLEELERFPYELKLPSFLPFEAKESSAKIVRESEPIGDMEKRYKLYIRYISENAGEETLLMQIENRLWVKERVSFELDEGQQFVELNDGTPAIYWESGLTNNLFWDEGELSYQIALPYSEFSTVDTLVKIAESFVINN